MYRHEAPTEFVPPSAPAANAANAVAAVLVFECGPEEIERVRTFLNTLKARGIVRHAHAAAFDETTTSAELYFP